jgi:aspartate carbamoyltransferase regulatory subunit
VTGILVCPNHNCITNADEPVRTAFEVLENGVRCTYCDTIIREGDVAEHIDTRGAGETAL